MYVGFCLLLPSAERRLPELCKPCLATGSGEGGQVFPHRHRTFQRLHNLPERQRWGAQPLLAAVAGSIPPLARGDIPVHPSWGLPCISYGEMLFWGELKSKCKVQEKAWFKLSVFLWCASYPRPPRHGESARRGLVLPVLSKPGHRGTKSV